ncbi:hypothetical protein GCM10010472_24230 [Pseudonocardia halophobica]|uniref:C-deglycosylation enzyme beta subunit n=1 Tax=Pseudonocardia halophobica TaxID=29401 RepID=A0A9W6NUP4_9PSEU|nr:DUF6379 domain-containing protein [Pseudonocardia halophobica]GLL09656.1 hypothetical protein GCM10017577_07960 [Pseudonocardia halophobica]
MFAHRLVVDDSLRPTDRGARFQIRLNWYRSLPLASLRVLDVTLDGTPVPAERIGVEVDGVRRALGELGPLIDVWWYVLDPATVHVDLGGPLAHGPHELTVRLGSRVPYIIIGPTIDDVYTVTDQLTTTQAA